MRRSPLLALMAGSLLVLAACSGGSSPSSAAASPAAASPAASAASSVAASTEPSTAASAEASGGTGGSAACKTASGTGTVAVTIQNFAFSPTPIKAKVGDTVTWTNKDSTAHTATLDDGSCSTDHVDAGASASLTFTAPGTYAYHCAIHPTMKGEIDVSG